LAFFNSDVDDDLDDDLDDNNDLHVNNWKVEEY